MHMRLAVLPSVILSVGTISTLLLVVGLQWGFAAEGESVDIHGQARDEPVKQLNGQIFFPKGSKLENALVEITQNGKTFSAPIQSDGTFTLANPNLKTGPATVKYKAPGFQTQTVTTDLTAQTPLTAFLPLDRLPPDRFPYGLFLLAPGIITLGFRAGLEWWWRRRDWDFRNLGLLLIIIILGLWFITFIALWSKLSDADDFTLHIFDPALSFSLAVPIFGFLGSLLFVIDVFQSRMPAALSPDQNEKQNINTSMEFVLRLVLGPYVAIVMVLLFRDTFTFMVGSAKEVGAQATVAFFSGFLVTLVLQGLSEKGNELLGQWRGSTRYEPSEIARELNLAQEEDLKLRKVNVKYLGHLQRLSDEDIVQMAKQSDMNEGLLFSLRDEARALRMYDVPLLAQYLHEQIGTAVWAKLQLEGIKSVWDLADLAARPSGEITDIAQRHNIDPDILTKYSAAAKALALAQHLQGRIGTAVWAKLQLEGIKSVWDLAACPSGEITDIAQKHHIDPEILTKYSAAAKALAITSFF